MRYSTLIIPSLLLLSLVQASAQTSPVTVSGVIHNQLGTPGIIPTVQVVGTCVGTSYAYEYVGVDAAGGMTLPSSPSATASGCASLNTTTTFNIVFTSAVTGATSCIVWRTLPSTGLLKGKVGSVPCGGAILDTNTNLDGSGPPGGNTTGSIAAGGTVTAMNFVASGTGAGTSDWVQGSALSACSTTQPQPCIQQNSFFISANYPLPATPFGWLSPSGPNSANSVLVVGNPGGGISSALSYGSLTDTSNTTPTIVTANGHTFSSNHIVMADSSGLNLADSGVSSTAPSFATSVTAPTVNATTGYQFNGTAIQASTIEVAFCLGNVGTTAGTFPLLPGSAVANCSGPSTTAVEVPMPYTCTAKNLYVVAGTAGNNGTGSGVTTLYKNGSTVTSLKCTLGTATSCHDTTDTVTLNAGETWSIRTTSNGASETLANVRASFQCQ